MRLTLAPFLAVTAAVATTTAAVAEPDLDAIVTEHILPGYIALATEADELATAAQNGCGADNTDLIPAYHDAFDAWVGVSHLRFGPSETNDRAFALAFWPDPRGSTPKALAALVAASDPIVESEDDFATVSIAARGFYAMEFLLFDAQFTEAADNTYHCALVQAVAVDIAANAHAILDDWQNGYGDLMISADNDTFRTPNEAARQLFTALTTGLEFTADTRLGRPMGTYDRPRPNRAEAWRSGRSLRNVSLSLESTRQLAALLSEGDPEIEGAFNAAQERAATLFDPIFASVETPDGWFRIELLSQSIGAVRTLLSEKLGPQLGVAAGFNSLDGD